jgi:hypothetical protein
MSSDVGLDAYGAVTWGEVFVYQGFNRTSGNSFIAVAEFGPKVRARHHCRRRNPQQRRKPLSDPRLRCTWMCKWLCTPCGRRERVLSASCLPHHSYILYIAGCAGAAGA